MPTHQKSAIDLVADPCRMVKASILRTNNGQEH